MEELGRDDTLLVDPRSYDWNGNVLRSDMVSTATTRGRPAASRR